MSGGPRAGVTDSTDHTDHAVHHHGISVADLDRSLAFYRDALGFELLDRYTLSDEGLSAAVGAEVTGEFAQLDGRGARIELVEYDAGAAVETRAVYDTGATHLGIEVADVDAAVEALPGDVDVDVVGGPRTTGSGTRICFLRDPDGTLVELLEL